MDRFWGSVFYPPSTRMDDVRVPSGDAASTAIFAEDVPYFGLTVHGESDGAKSERSEVLTAVNNAHLLAGCVDAAPGRMLPALLKELALTTTSEAPFDVFIRLRLSLLLKGLWNPPNTATAARPAVASVTYVPRVFGPIVERALAEDMGMHLLCDMITGVPPSEGEFSTMLLSEMYGMLASMERLSMFSRWSPAPIIRAPADLTACSFKSSTVVSGSLIAVMKPPVFSVAPCLFDARSSQWFSVAFPNTAPLVCVQLDFAAPVVGDVVVALSFTAGSSSSSPLPPFPCRNETSVLIPLPVEARLLGTHAVRVDIRSNIAAPILRVQLHQEITTPLSTVKHLMTSLSTWLLEAASTCSMLRREALRCLTQLAYVTGSLAVSLDLVSGLLAQPSASLSQPEPAQSSSAPSLTEGDLCSFSGNRALLPLQGDAAMAPVILAFLVDAAGKTNPTQGLLEAPMCVEISRSMVITCLRIMRKCLADSNAASMGVVEQLLKLLAQNFRFLSGSAVDPAAIGLTGRTADGDDPVEGLAGLLMDIVLGKWLEVPSSVAEAAAALVLSQLKLFMRIASAATSIGVMDLYRIHTTKPFPKGSVRVKLIEECLKSVAASVTGSEDGNDMLRPPESSVSASAYLASVHRASTIKVLDTLCAMPANVIEGSADGTSSSDLTYSLSRLTLPIIRTYTYKLLQVVALYVKPPHPPSMQLLEGSGACVALADLVKRCCSCAPPYYDAFVSGIATTDGSAKKATEAMSKVWESVSGAILLEVLTGVSAFWRSRALAEALVPSLIPVIASVRRAVTAYLGQAPSSVETIVKLERVHDGLFGRSGAPPMLFTDVIRTGDWMMQLLGTATWLSGHFAAVLISGLPVLASEEKLAPWLSTPLFVAGLDEGASLNGEFASERAALMAIEPSVAFYESSEDSWNTYMESGGYAGLSEQDRLDTVRSSSRESNRSSHSVDGRYHQAIEKDPENPGADTDVDKLIAWFDVVKKVSRVKQRTMLVVPSVERPVVAALLKHSGQWKQGMAVVAKVRSGTPPSAISLTPELEEVVNLLHKLRKVSRDEQLAIMDAGRGEDDSPQPVDASESKASDEVAKAAAIGVMQMGMQKRAEFLLTVCGSAGVCRSDHGKHQLSGNITPVLQFLEVQAIEALQDRGSTGLFEWSPIPESPFVQESVGMDQPVDEVEDDVTAEEEADGDLKPSKPESAGPHSATLTAVLNFVQHGRDVPPKLLQSVMLRRKLRAAQRCRGLFAMHRIVLEASLPSLIAPVITLLRPAFSGAFSRGSFAIVASPVTRVLAGGAEESKDDGIARSTSVQSSPLAGDDTPVQPVEVWGRHHPLCHLEGCPLQTQLQARIAFQHLYAMLTPMIVGGVIDKQSVAPTPDSSRSPSTVQVAVPEFTPAKAHEPTHPVVSLDRPPVSAFPLGPPPPSTFALDPPPSSSFLLTPPPPSNFADFGAPPTQPTAPAAITGPVVPSVPSSVSAAPSPNQRDFGTPAFMSPAPVSCPVSLIDMPCFSRLARAVMWAWALDLDGPSDFEFALKVRVLDAVANLASVKELYRSAKVLHGKDAAGMGPSTLPAFAIHPWSRQRVHNGILSGTLAKRDLIYHMKRVAGSPLYAKRLPHTWWNDNHLTGPLTTVVQRVDAGSLLRMYDKFLVAMFLLPEAGQVHQLANAVITLQAKFPGYQIRKLGNSYGLESIEGIDGDKVIAEAAYVSCVSTQTADEWFGGLSTGVCGSSFGNRKAAFALFQLLNLCLFAGASAVRASGDSDDKKSSDEKAKGIDEATPKPVLSDPSPAAASPTAAVVDVAVQEQAVFTPPVNHEASLSHLLSAQAQARYLHGVVTKFVVADLNCVVDALMSSVAEPIPLNDTQSADVTLVEPLELERHLFRLLQHVLQLASIPAAARELSTATVVSVLLKILYPSASRVWISSGDVRVLSPRCRRLALKIIGELGETLSPTIAARGLQLLRAEYGASATTRSPFLRLRQYDTFEHFMLGWAGELICGGNNASLDSIGDRGDATINRALADPCDVGPGAANQAFVADLLAMMHTMSKSRKSWHAAIEYEVMETLRNVIPLLKCVTDLCEFNKDLTFDDVASSLSKTSTEIGMVHRAAASLALMGGSLECVRVGARVRVGAGGGEGAIGTVVSMGKLISTKALPNESQLTSSDAIALATEGCLVRGGVGMALVAFSNNIETVPVTDLIAVLDTENEGRGLSVSFVLRLDPTEQCDDFVVGFFVKTLSLEAPNVMEAIGASGGDYGLGSKKSSAAATRSSSPITKRGPLTAAGGMTKTEGVSLLAPPDAEVMVKLSTLFAMSQLKFFSLRALPVCLHRPGFPAAIGRARLLPVLLNAALEPLRVPTLLTFQSLEERRTTLLRFLLEASQSIDGIKLLTPPREIADRVIRLCLNVSSSSSADEFSTGNPVKDALAAAIASLTGSIKEGDGAGGLVDRRKLEARRRKYAQTLAEVTGKPLRLCELGLEMNGDNPDAAMVWLDSPAAARFIEDVEDDIDDPSTPAVASHWACVLCTFHNAQSDAKCSLCGTAKPVQTAVAVSGSSGPSGAAGSSEAPDENVFVSDDAAIEGIGDAPPLFDDGSVTSAVALLRADSAPALNVPATAAGSGTGGQPQPQPQPAGGAAPTTPAQMPVLPRPVVIRGLMLMPGNSFSFYEDRQWVQLDVAACRSIQTAVSGSLPEARYLHRGRTKLLDLTKLIQREAGSSQGHVVRVVRNDGLEMMRGNPNGEILINQSAETALRQAMMAQTAPPGATAAGAPTPAGQTATPAPAPGLTPGQKALMTVVGNHWFYAEGGAWKPMPPQIVSGLQTAISQGAPGVAFDWGPHRFGIDFKTFIMTNLKSGVGHLVLVARPDRSEILRGHIQGATWKITPVEPTPAAAAPVVPISQQAARPAPAQVPPSTPGPSLATSAPAASPDMPHMTRSYSGRVTVGPSIQTGPTPSSQVGGDTAASLSAYVASVALNLKPVVSSTPSAAPKTKANQLAASIPVWDGMLLCASQKPGPSPARGCETVVLTTVIKDSGMAVVKSWDDETGACLTEWSKVDLSYYYPFQIGGASTSHAGSLIASLIVTDCALATHYARRAVVEVCGSDTLSGGSADLGIEPVQLLMLTKLVAASENECGRTSGSKMPPRTPLMTALLGLLQRLLSAEVIGSTPLTSPDGSWKCFCSAINPKESTVCIVCSSTRSVATKALTAAALGAAGPLGKAFAEECARNIEASTQVRAPARRKPKKPVEKKEITGDEDGEDAGGNDDVIVLESMHPHPVKYEYSGVVYLAGASAMRVVIDKRTTLDPTRASLTLYADADRHTAIKTITAGNEAPFVVHSDRIAYTFKDQGKADGSWGFRVVISPVWRLQWLREAQVLTSPSLEWGMWLMSFLMTEAPEVAATGALHHRLIFDSLVRYLRSPALPYKSRVIALLSQLLSSHHLFSPSDPPHLSALEGVRAIVMKKAQDEHTRQRLFLPVRLVQLVQLCVLAKRAETGERFLPVDPAETGALNPPVNTYARAPEFDTQSVEAVLMDLLGVVESLLYNRRLPDALFNAAFRKANNAFPSAGGKVVQDTVRRNATWRKEQDIQLVRWVEDIASRRDVAPADLPLNDLSLSREDSDKYTALTGIPPNLIRFRVAVMQVLNERLAKMLSFIDFVEEEDVASGEVSAGAAAAAAAFDSRWSLGAKIRAIGHCVFLNSKLPLLQACVDATVSEKRPDLQYLHRGKALMSKSRNMTHPASSQCLFVQAFTLLNGIESALLRAKPDPQKEFVFPVKFRTFNATGGDEDESGLDWGGLYREAMNTFVEDVFDVETLTLCIPTPNLLNHVNSSDAYIPNPVMTTPLALGMFEFLGKLMGMSIRNRMNLPFRFPSIVWKRLVMDPIEISDIDAIDSVFVRMLNKLRSPDVPASMLGNLTYTVPRSDNVRVPLISGGAQKPVGPAGLPQYCDMIEHFRRHEFDMQCAAMLKGLCQLIPPRSLPLFSWEELENLVCGSKTVDVMLLQKHTTYIQPYHEGHETVKSFWRVMQSFTNEDRVMFLRFCWGRSRLPAAGRWGNERKFKLSKLSKQGTNDATLPLAHSCFFNLELPDYSTQDIMRKRLLTAMNYSVGYYGIV